MSNILAHPEAWFDVETPPNRSGYTTTESVLTFCPKMRNYCPFIVGRAVIRYKGDGSVGLLEKWESCETGEEIYPSRWQPIEVPSV